MSYITKSNTEGGGGKRGCGQRNIFWNKNQTNNNTNYQTRKLKYLETATYTMSQFYLANWYGKVTKDIIRYVIRKLPGGIHLTRGMRNGKIPNMSLDPKKKQEKNPDGTSAVEEDEY